MTHSLSRKRSIITILSAVIAISFNSASYAQISKGLEFASKLASKVEALPSASRAAALSEIGSKIGQRNLTLTQLKKLEISAEAYGQAINVASLKSNAVTESRNLGDTQIAKESVNTGGTTLGKRGATEKKSALEIELANLDAKINQIPVNADVKLSQTKIIEANKVIANETGVMVLGEEACGLNTGSFYKLDAVAYKNLETVMNNLTSTAKSIKQKFPGSNRLKCAAQNLTAAFMNQTVDVLNFARNEALKITETVNGTCLRKTGAIVKTAQKWMASGSTEAQVSLECAM
jgi:hypothetical protein